MKVELHHMKIKEHQHVKSTNVEFRSEDPRSLPYEDRLVDYRCRLVRSPLTS
jgi:hypothetical protein